jgi:hypothetical protein
MIEEANKTFSLDDLIKSLTQSNGIFVVESLGDRYERKTIAAVSEIVVINQTLLPDGFLLELNLKSPDDKIKILGNESEHSIDEFDVNYSITKAIVHVRFFKKGNAVLTIIVDKVRIWRVGDYIEKPYQEAATLTDIVTTFKREIKILHENASLIPQRPIIIQGMPASGKSTLTSRLNGIKIPDYTYHFPEFTNNHSGVYRRKNIPTHNIGATDLAGYILSTLNTMIVDNTFEAYWNGQQCRVESLNNGLLSRIEVTKKALHLGSLGLPVVFNGSLLQYLIGSLSYYKINPFQDNEDDTMTPFRSSERYSELERRLTKEDLKQNEEIVLEVAIRSGLFGVIRNILIAMGNPNIIYTQPSEELRASIFLELKPDEIIRRRRALNNEKWIEIWQEVIKILLKYLGVRMHIVNLDADSITDMNSWSTQVAASIPSKSLVPDWDKFLAAAENDLSLLALLGESNSEVLVDLFQRLVSNPNCIRIRSKILELIESYITQFETTYGVTSDGHKDLLVRLENIKSVYFADVQNPQSHLFDLRQYSLPQSVKGQIFVQLTNIIQSIQVASFTES